MTTSSVLALADVTVGIGAFHLLSLIMVVWSLVGMARKPSWAWAESGRSRPLWIVAVALGLVLPFYGFLIAMVSLLWVLPAVGRVERLGRRPGFARTTNFPQ